jgi:CheY-like chemotaxis protein
MSTERNKPFEILLVEDNPLDALLVQRCFQELAVPNHLSVIADGEKALIFLHRGVEYADAPRPDLILLDLNLPKVSGLEVLAAVKTAPDLRQIPVIVLSVSEDAKDIFQAYNLQASCYLTKPHDVTGFRDLARTIESFWLKQATLPAPSEGQPAE